MSTCARLLGCQPDGDYHPIGCPLNASTEEVNDADAALMQGAIRNVEAVLLKLEPYGGPMYCIAQGKLEVALTAMKEASNLIGLD